MTKDEILREKILKGADLLFQKNGMEKTTMEDIAREAGKGKSTLYYYFKSKEEIFEAIIQNEKDKYYTRLQEQVAEAPTARLKLKAMFRTRMESIRETTNLYNLIINEMKENLEKRCISLYKNYRSDVYDKEGVLVKNILQYGIVTGEFKTMSESELDLITFCFISSKKGMDIELVWSDSIDQFINKIDFIVDLLVEGIQRKATTQN